MDRSELIKYWLESSDRDFITMEHLFEKKDFHWSLFIGYPLFAEILSRFRTLGSFGALVPEPQSLSKEYLSKTHF